MYYKIFSPPPQLKDLVQCFWGLESNAEESVPGDYFLMADSCAEIIFQYNHGFQNYSAQSARMRFQHSIHDKFKVAEKLGFFGVRLYPHAVNQLLGMPANEMANRVFDFCALFKQEGTDLADQVYNSKTMDERIVWVSNFLINKTALYTVDPVNYFVDQIVKNDGWVDISRLQKESRLSVKQFERRFKAIAGFPPKYFARLARFQGIKNKYCSKQFKTMTGLAYSCNYYDQSHFNREFKEFSGVQPLQYFKFRSRENEDTRENDRITPGSQPVTFDGYLPCGWFV